MFSGIYFCLRFGGIYFCLQFGVGNKMAGLRKMHPFDPWPRRRPTDGD